MAVLFVRAQSRAATWLAAMALAGIVGCGKAPNESHAGGASASAAGAPETGPAASGVPVDLAQGWCNGHGVPESVCTRCHAALIDEFKAAADWCNEHGLPESQCTLCDPRIAAAWRALQPPATDAAGGDAGDGGIGVEPVNGRLLTGRNDPLCQVDTRRVRFRDAQIVLSAGIETAPAARQRISATIELPAEVEFDATRVTRVTPRVSGVVQTVHVNVGDNVATGDLLAVMESTALGEARSEFIQRRGDHVLAQADLERVLLIHDGTTRLLAACQTDATPEQVRDRLEGVPVGQARSQLLRAHAALLLARATAERERHLREKNISTQQDYDAARSGLSAAEADFVATREETAFEIERSRLAAQRAVQVTRSSLDAAERRLHILGLTQEQVDRLGGDADTSLSRYELRSPAGGRVVQRSVSAGEAVQESDALFVLADTSATWLMMDASERDLPMLRAGLAVLFTADGLPGRSFEGRVAWVASQLDDRTRTVAVRADLPNADGLLRGKMFGRARIVVHEDEPVVAVPQLAVQTDGCCQLVFVRSEDTLFEPRKVALGSSAGGYVEILRGLTEGEVVATVGSFLMKTEILKGNIGAGCCEVDPGR